MCSKYIETPKHLVNARDETEPKMTIELILNDKGNKCAIGWLKRIDRESKENRMCEYIHTRARAHARSGSIPNT